MNTGKTYAAAELVGGPHAARLPRRRGQADGRLAHARRPGDGGARAPSAPATFTEAGVVASTGRNMVPIAKGLIAHLNECAPDVIVLELGDGIIGPYGVDDILQDMEMQRLTAAHVLAATDLAGRVGRRPALPQPVPRRARRRRRPGDGHRSRAAVPAEHARRARHQRAQRGRAAHGARRRDGVAVRGSRSATASPPTRRSLAELRWEAAR